MMRALFSGVTGLKTHQTRMDVIGNNIANVNTLGFKKSAANFADLYSETVTPASAPSATQGGINAQQVGLGVNVNSIVIKHTPGAAQYTGNTLDLAISGDGYFVLRTGAGERYSRAGNLSVSSNGSLVNPSGYFVQGYNAIYQQGTAGDASTTVGITNDTQVAGKYDTFKWTPDAATVKSQPAGSYTFEAQADGTVNMYKNGILQSNLKIKAADGTDATTLTAGATYHLDTGFGKLEFNALANVAAGDFNASVYSDLSTAIDNMRVELKNNDTFTAGNRLGDIIIDQDVYENVTINEEGAVIAQLKKEGIPIGPDGQPIPGAQTMAKGEKVVLGYVALANFPNVEGLEKVATNLYASTANTGRVSYNLAGAGGTGSITPSSLEMSNVDLSEEMVNMITTQRGFQANSRIITTTDSMLEELVNLKR